MTAFTVTLIRAFFCKDPLDFWQKAVATVPELENSANTAFSKLIYVVIHNGVMKLWNYSWVGTVVVPKGISGVAVLYSTTFPPPLPTEGMVTVTAKSKYFVQIELYDTHWHFLYEPYNGPGMLPLDPGSYSGNWKRRVSK